MPGVVAAQVVHGWALVGLGEQSAATGPLRAAVRITSARADRALLSSAQLALGRALRRQGDGRGADEHLTQALALSTEHGLPRVRRAVLRDLAWLLNTVNFATTEDLAQAPLAARSAVNFGLPGFAGLLRSSSQVTGLEAAIVQAIRAFDPRIRPDTVRVRAHLPDPDNPAPTLLFDIEGELWAQPAPQQIFIETSIEIETRLAVVTDAAQRRE